MFKSQEEIFQKISLYLLSYMGCLATPALKSILITFTIELRIHWVADNEFVETILMLESIIFALLKTMMGKYEEDSREHGGFCWDKHNSSTLTPKSCITVMLRNTVWSDIARRNAIKQKTISCWQKRKTLKYKDN